MFEGPYKAHAVSRSSSNNTTELVQPQSVSHSSWDTNLSYTSLGQTASAISMNSGLKRSGTATVDRSYVPAASTSRKTKPHSSPA
eukprot:4088265-Prymnesium_polylepis.1